MHLDMQLHAGSSIRARLPNTQPLHTLAVAGCVGGQEGGPPPSSNSLNRCCSELRCTWACTHSGTSVRAWSCCSWYSYDSNRRVPACRARSCMPAGCSPQVKPQQAGGHCARPAPAHMPQCLDTAIPPVWGRVHSAKGGPAQRRSGQWPAWGAPGRTGRALHTAARAAHPRPGPRPSRSAGACAAPGHRV